MTPSASRRSAHSGAGAVGAVMLGFLVATALPIALHARERLTEAQRGGQLPVSASHDWWSGVRKGIAATEYQVTWSDRTVLADVPEALQAPNRAQGFRTYFTKSGIRVVPRAEEQPSWEWGLALHGYGWAGDVRAVSGAEPRASANRVDYDRAELTEWYVNSPHGLEQGFTLDPPLEASEFADTSKVVVEMALHGGLGAYPAENAQSIEFAHGTARVLRYADLKVTDNAGSPLPAHMEVASLGGEGPKIRLVVGVETAIWPITIDPLATSPNWTSESNQASAYFGCSVASAGDVNGDGYADVIVGAYLYDNGQTDEGRVFVFHGSASGPSTTADWTAESNEESANFGQAVASAGDVNGDGYADVVVGSPYYGSGNEGRAFLWLGSASGLGAAGNPANADWSAGATHANDWAGWSVASAGDVNGDGYADVIVGAKGWDGTQSDEGAAFVYFGSSAGPSSSYNWRIEGLRATAGFGTSVASAGDVNGDGFADVIVGAAGWDNDQTDEGGAFVYNGSASGLPSGESWMAEGDQTSAALGSSVASAGDVNGDGYADVIVGADHYDNGQADEGGAFLWYGSASGLGAQGSPANADWSAESDCGSGFLGGSLASAGDVNGDGYADVLIGARYYSASEPFEGGAFLWLGSVDGLGEPGSPANADWTATGDQSAALFGFAVASAGDVNGDGYADLIVGAPEFDGGQINEGRAFVYLGSASGPGNTSSWTAGGSQYLARFGFSVASAGDVNGDGYGDVIVGADQYDHGEDNEGAVFLFHGSIHGPSVSPDWTAEANQTSAYFGRSVASAGDVNGDGFADIVASAPNYNNGEAAEGRVFVWYGSATGLGDPGVPTNADWSAEGNQAGAQCGSSVASAGDVNGDGYADVIVGAYLYDNDQADEGALFVWHGSASGINGGVAGTPSNAAWTADSNAAGAVLGYSVASAGDVNGDGYGDVIAGAHQYTNGQSNEGLALVWLGSASGVNGGVAGAPTNAAWTAESNQASAYLGYSVASAGDVNGDGYADVVVGAYGFNGGLTKEGAAFGWYGSSEGLGPAGTPGNADWSVKGNQASAYFGRSVASAGDVNGDGYADVIVGAYVYDNPETDEGRAFLYLGSAAGLSTSASWTAESNQADAFLGQSVASAGDVNGDGYADVIVGAYKFDDLQSDEGRAFVYYGNAGIGRPVLAQQLKGGGSSTLQQAWGSAGETDEFQVRARHSSPFGRERIKVEVEGCPPGVPFGHASCVRTTSPSWTDSTASAAGASLTETLSGLNGGTLYRWRERTLWAPYSVTQSGITPPPNPAHGPWRRLGAQAVEADIRTASVTAHTLTVGKDGTGTGTVTSDPAGINCGGTCSYDFAAGTEVDLTAAANAGCKFMGWSGEGCSGTGTCHVTMTIDRSVTATFTSCTVAISGRTYGGTETEASCGTLAFGPTVLVTGTGNLTARAATRVSLRNGFEVATGGRFTAGIDPGLAP